MERNKKTEFQFTKVLGPECGQTTVFEECVTPLIDKFMRNESCLIFSYGATNSGKTYTLQGTFIFVLIYNHLIYLHFIKIIKS